MRALGWEQADVVFVTGDAYVDHPSFAMAILGRWLEKHGLRVAILSQPDWSSARAWRALGRPRLFYAVSAGNMDSMINHYTANKKKRNSDAYSPGGRIGLRPDRATAVYAQRCREAFKGVPVVTGGVEASLRRVAHYDYWSDKVLPSNLVSSKADLLVFGMGERTILEIARRLAAGQDIEKLRDLRGVAYLLGRSEVLPDHRWAETATATPVELPSYEAVSTDKRRFAEATRLLHRETNPLSGRRLLQRHGDRTAVVNPPALALEPAELDALYELPYARRPHPSYAGRSVPACSFCSITLHQGRAIQSRSPESILGEIRAMAAEPEFKGTISDLGGPTANMYGMHCRRPEVEAVCRRLSCLHPSPCRLLETSHAALVELMRESRRIEGVKRVHVASGIRMDLACEELEYLDELARFHVGGHLKVAPEHVSDEVLDVMKKPPRRVFEEFAARFGEASRRAGKEQFLVPYFIAGHPGGDTEEMIELALFLKRAGYRPRQVQDFIPAPMDIATCMFYTGLDPASGKPVKVARKPSQRLEQRALLQFFKPENYLRVKKALHRAGRHDLIGDGPDCLIGARPPRREVIEASLRQGARPREGRNRRG